MLFSSRSNRRTYLQPQTAWIELPDSEDKARARPKRAQPRRWFPILAIGIGLLPVCAAELALRFVAGPSASWRDPSIDVSTQPRLFIDADDGMSMHVDPSRSNFFQPAEFTKPKSTRTRRVFVLGGSTVQGRPYATETAFAKWLQLMLGVTDDEHTYEVVNCGGVSYASYRVAKILDEVLNYEPDAIVIYTGHNEFLEDRTYADIRESSSLRRTTRRIASSLHSVRAIERWMHGKRPPPASAPEVKARLDEAGGLDAYQRDRSWQLGVEADFHATLESMIQRCQDANVPLVLCVPASDVVRTPPFKIAVDPVLSSNEQDECATLWNTIVQTDDRNEKTSALAKLIKLDAMHAGANFLIGRQSFDTGNTDAAKSHLAIARDYDVCPLRATNSIVNSVQQLALKHRVPVVDVQVLLDENNDGIADPENFVDHVHPSIAAHQRIAIAVAKALAWDPIDDAHIAAFRDMASQHLSSLGEEYYARGRQRLKGLQQWAAGRAGLPTQD